MFESGSPKPVMIVAMPRSVSAGTIGSVPPERISAGRTPIDALEGVEPELDRLRIRRDEPRRGEDDSRSTSIARARGRGLVEQPLERLGDLVDLLPGREPDREIRDRLDREHRLLKVRRAALEPVHVECRLGERPEVELLGGAVRSSRPRALEPRARRSPFGSCAQPASSASVGGTSPFRSGSARRPSCATMTREIVLRERMRGVQRGPAVEPRVEVALTRPNRDVEVDEPARREHERGQAAPDHVGVEDHRRVGAALVGREEVDDRVAADLLLAVAAEPDVDRQLARPCELAGGREQQVELALVVDRAAAVEVAVAELRLERIALPELERRRRLHVEVAVAEDGRRRPASGGGDLADRERAGRSSRRPRPARRRRATKSRTHSAARRTSAPCAGSALTEGMRRNSASSSNQGSAIASRVYATSRSCSASA